MQLSEAIRLGAMMRPQAFGHLFTLDGASSCALGAAAEAIGCNHRSTFNASRLETVRNQFPILETVATCPARCSSPLSVEGIIVHLNDGHRWTREAIADWVASHERDLSSKTVDAVREESLLTPV